jgi:hypothetical protein
MKKIKVILIGFGKMGHGLGYKDKLSHYGALTSLKNKFIIKSVVDKKFKRKEGIYTSNLIEALAETQPDMAVISVSSKDHFKIINQILENKFCPDILFLEKPSFQNLKEFNKIEKILKKKKDKEIIINQTYRFDKNLNKFRNYVANKKLGNLHKISIIYTNGLKNNAIHLIDAFFYIFSTDFNFKKIWSKKNLNNNSTKDKINYDFYLLDKKKKIEFTGQSFDNNIFEVFEITFYFSNCRVIIGDYFREFLIQKIKYDRFKNKEIGVRKKLFNYTQNYPLISAYCQIYDYFLSKKIDKKLKLSNNKKTLEIISKIENNAKN